jgi:signal transduction histidine kinase
MSRLPIRARIAPVALAIVFGFVVIGFLKADREMTRAERDRAILRASESATFVEAFLFRHSDWLRAAEPSLRSQGERDSHPATSSRVGSPTRNNADFEALWVIDSTGVIRAAAALQAGVPVPTVGTSMLHSAAHVPGEALANVIRSRSDEPDMLVSGRGARQRLLFVLPLRMARGTFAIGVLPADSLTALLRQRQTAATQGLIIRAASDTIVNQFVQEPGDRTQSVRAPIRTPFARNWTLTMVYSPSGRGVRIALWVVGLGAVIGLGIGLLLERREANRIADRSSELEHLSAELLRANRAKSEFLANVSHELRTPLNAIVGFVDLLRDGVYGALNARQVGPVERIEASANHLRHLVDQVLDLAKMAAGRLEVHTEPLELRPFVFDVASEVEPLITEKGLSFSLTVGATLPRVRTDPTHLRQILINLLGNAVKFTTTGGISVRGKLVGAEARSGLPSVLNAATALLMRSPRPDGLWIALQVVDSGVGIAEQDRERIFDEFEQVNAGPRGDSMRRGTGLGLSISRRLARLIGGDITVESELGRGSVFTVWLPVDPADLRGDRAA